MKRNTILPRGIWSVMLTPFNVDKSINYTMYANLINFYINSGAAGLFASCGSSEMTELSNDELITLAEKAVGYSKGRVPVVGGAIIVDAFDKQIDLIKQMAQTGVDAVTISMSQFGSFEETEDTIVSRIERILDKTHDISMGLYECPSPYRRIFSPEAYARLIGSGRFCFHKDTCCNAEEIKRKLELTRGSSVIFLNAHFPTLAKSLAYGGDGYCGVAGNFFPDLLYYICDNYFKKGVIDYEVCDFITAADDIIRNKYPLSAKMFLNEFNGVIETKCRVNVELPNQADISNIVACVNDYKELRSRVFESSFNSFGCKDNLAVYV